MTTHKAALTALVHEMEYVLSCINADKVPFDGDDFHEALRLGKTALAQPAVTESHKQSTPCGEPVANYCKECLTYNGHQEACSHYTTPPTQCNCPQRTWVGLTDEDKKEYVAQDFGGNRLDAMDWAAKRLQEKNT